jgi:hypothetical protein
MDIKGEIVSIAGFNPTHKGICRRIVLSPAFGTKNTVIFDFTGLLLLCTLVAQHDLYNLKKPAVLSRKISDSCDYSGSPGSLDGLATRNEGIAYVATRTISPVRFAFPQTSRAGYQDRRLCSIGL